VKKEEKEAIKEVKSAQEVFNQAFKEAEVAIREANRFEEAAKVDEKTKAGEKAKQKEDSKVN